ncbi:hypothetical protein CBER1_09287 [Cercospora berteroae]|uniref:C2H2-type domain-containing protein n=1 Tax=Cercospora berteroae TaxID=357750 RepID=A0A2S6CFG5_9PEZI|nr:hypothetical protein CBER1_09287 [Cercospora berteroae]
MPKRKRMESLESVLARPACYYCDRDFDDLKILHDHQKARHFLCQAGNCNRKLGTVGGLRIHMHQVHKEELQEVPNAIEGRNNLALEIFGEFGAPEEWKEARTASVTQYYQGLARQHYLETGNPLPGQIPPEEASKPKRPRLEDEIASGSLKAQVQARKAAREAERAKAAAAAAAGGSLSTPPNGTMATPPSSVTAAAMPFHPSPFGAGPAPASLPQGSSPMNFTTPAVNSFIPPPHGQFLAPGHGLPPTPVPSNSGYQFSPQGSHPLPLHQPAPQPVSQPVVDEAAHKAHAVLQTNEFFASLGAPQQGDIAPNASAPTTPQPQGVAKPKSVAKGEDLKFSDKVSTWEEKRYRALGYHRNTDTAAGTTVGAPTDNATGTSGEDWVPDSRPIEEWSQEEVQMFNARVECATNESTVESPTNNVTDLFLAEMKAMIEEQEREFKIKLASDKAEEQAKIDAARRAKPANEACLSTNLPLRQQPRRENADSTSL